MPASQLVDLQSTYQGARDLLIEHMKSLPLTELHYYTALLVASIQNDSYPEQHILLLKHADALVMSITQLYKNADAEDAADNLVKVTTALNDLIRLSHMKSTTQKIKKVLLAICSVVLGAVIGLFAGIVGLTAGLLSDYTVIGNLRGAYLGFLTGLGMGAYIGSRCSDMIFQSAFERKLEFCIEGIKKVGAELESEKWCGLIKMSSDPTTSDAAFQTLKDVLLSKAAYVLCGEKIYYYVSIDVKPIELNAHDMKALEKIFPKAMGDLQQASVANLADIKKLTGHTHTITHKDYEKMTKDYILNTFFKDTPDDDKESEYNKFLLSTDQSFEVCTTTASFGFRGLKGHIGHHTLIRFEINGVKDRPIEFGDRTRTPGFVDQKESRRVVTGQKLYDMLLLDRILQETHELNNRFLATTYDLGSNDCRTYVDKVLIGTGQPPTIVPRFNPQHDSWAGKHVIGPIVRFFSKTNERELKPYNEYYKDGNELTVEAMAWSPKNKPTLDSQKCDDGEEAGSAPGITP